jgi:hypothetical protein
MTEKTTPVDFDFFWLPSLKDLNDLTVESNDEGILLSDPVGTLCSDWLAYWSETPEREALFSQEFQKVLLDHLKILVDENGESTLTDRQENHRVPPEEVGTGTQQAD